MDEFIDAYAVLGVEPTADQVTIKAAYRRMAARHHPDVAPGDRRHSATARMQTINIAYGLVGQPDVRRQYDQVRVLHRARGTIDDAEALWSQLLWSAGRWIGSRRTSGSWYRAGFVVGRWLRGGG